MTRTFATPASTVAAPAPTPVQASAPSRGWLAEFLLLGALWGASFLFMRLGAAEFGPMPTAGLRVAVASLFLLPLALWRGKAPDLARHWRPIAVAGVFNSAVPFALFSFAVMHIPTGLTAILNATVPMFGALVAWIWLGDRLNASRSVGLLMGFLGVALLAWNKSGGGGASGADAYAGWAVAGCLAATLCYGVAASFAKKSLGGVNPLATATGSQLVATLVLAAPALWWWPAQMPSLRAWLAVAALGVLCTGIAYILFFRLIERAGPAKALTVTFVIPVFAVVYGVAVLGERVTWWMLGCGLVIVCGTMLSTGIVKLGRRAG